MDKLYAFLPAKYVSSFLTAGYCIQPFHPWYATPEEAKGLAEVEARRGNNPQVLISCTPAEHFLPANEVSKTDAGIRVAGGIWATQVDLDMRAVRY